MDAQTWTKKVDALRRPGGGALTLDVIMYNDRAELARRALAGDQQSKRLMRTLHEMQAAVVARSRPAVQCSTCPSLLRNVRWAAVIAVPELSTDPAQALLLAICTGCGPTVNDVQAKARPVLQRVFPGTYAVGPRPSGPA